MQLTMDEAPVYQPAPIQKTRIWTGRIISGLLILFFVFDTVGKFLKPAPVVEAFAQSGFPIGCNSVAHGGTIV